MNRILKTFLSATLLLMVSVTDAQQMAKTGSDQEEKNP